MGSAVHKANKRKLFLMLLLVAVAAAAYLTVDVSFSNERLFRYAMKIRIPKLIVMLITAFAIRGRVYCLSVHYQQYHCNTLPFGYEFPVYADSYGCGLCGRLRKLSGGKRQCFLCRRFDTDGHSGYGDLQLSF